MSVNQSIHAQVSYFLTHLLSKWKVAEEQLLDSTWDAPHPDLAFLLDGVLGTQHLVGEMCAFRILSEVLPEELHLNPWRAIASAVL